MAVFGGVGKSEASWLIDWDFTKYADGIDPRITVGGGANCTRYNTSGNLEVKAAPRVNHNPVGRTNTIRNAVNQCDSTYWLQSVGSWWSNVNVFNIAPPVAGALVCKYTCTNAPSDNVFARNSSPAPAGNRDASAYLYVPSGQGITNWRFRADWQDVEASAYSASQTTFDSWVRLNSAATLAAIRTFVDFNIQVNGSSAPSPGFVFYMAAPQESDALTAWIATYNSAITVYDSLGLLGEPLYAEYVRNSTCAGAVVGTPGTRATYWDLDKHASQTVDVVGVSQESGIEYTDYRVTAASNGRDYIAFYTEQSSGAGIPANAAEVWTAGAHVKCTAGTLPSPGNWELWLRQMNSGGTSLQDSKTSFTPAASTAKLASNRITVTGTTPTNTTKLTPFVFVYNMGIGAVLDFTIRIGLPQCTKSSFLKLPAKTSSVGLDTTPQTYFCSGTNFSSWYNTVQGTFTLQFTPINLTVNDVYWGIGEASNFNNSLYLVNASGFLTLIGYSAGVNTIFIVLGAMPAAGTTCNVAISYKSGEVVARLNGGAEGTSAGALPAVVNNESILCSPWNGGAGYPSCYFNRKRYSPYARRSDLYALSMNLL